jgi:hypothetical protein
MALKMREYRRGCWKNMVSGIPLNISPSYGVIRFLSSWRNKPKKIIWCGTIPTRSQVNGSGVHGAAKLSLLAPNSSPRTLAVKMDTIVSARSAAMRKRAYKRRRWNNWKITWLNAQDAGSSWNPVSFISSAMELPRIYVRNVSRRE